MAPDPREAAKRDAADPPRDLGLACLLAVGTAALYVLRQQEVYWSDGFQLVLRAEVGSWAISNPAYLPVVQLFHAVASRLGVSSYEQSMLLVAALTTALAVAAVFRACRSLELSRAASATTALLFGLAPGVLFHATTVEVHTLQLLAAAWFTAWIARAWQRDVLFESAVPWAFGLVGLGLTHPTGWFWGPALAVLLVVGLVLRERPRGVGVALLVVAAGVVTALLFPTPSPETNGNVWRDMTLAVTWTKLAYELAATLAVLWIPIAAFVVFRFRGEIRGALPGRLRAALAVLLVTMTLLVIDLATFEFGAYFFSLLPLLALLAGVAMSRSRRVLVAGIALVPIQLGIAEAARWDWNHGSAPAWVTELRERDDGPFLVLCESVSERRLVRVHAKRVAHNLNFAILRLQPSDLVRTLAPEPPTAGELSDPAFLEFVASIQELLHTRTDGTVTLLVTRRLHDSANPLQRAWLDGLEELLGPPRWESEGYGAYPRPDEPSEPGAGDG